MRRLVALEGRVSAFAAAIIIFCLNGAGRADTLKIQGSSTFNATIATPYASLVEAETGHKLDIIPNRSNLGLLALFEGKADIAMLSTTIEKEIEIVRRTRPDLAYERLQAFEVGESRVGLIVHPDNPLRRVTLDEVRGLISGQITNWREIGGPDLRVQVVATRDGPGVLASVEAQLLGEGRLTAPNLIRVQIGTQVVRVVTQEPGALGITQLAHARSGGARELETDRPIAQKLSLVTLGDPTHQAQAVIASMRRLAGAENERDR